MGEYESARLEAVLAPPIAPRFFCCTADLGVPKDPVAVADVSPLVLFPGDSIDYDGSGSYDPDGTVTGYDWDFGDESAGSMAVSGTHGYDDVGEYTVTLTVTDGTGLTGTAEVVVQVVERVEYGSGVNFAATGAAAPTTRGLYFSADAGCTDWQQKVAFYLVYDAVFRLTGWASSELYVATADGGIRVSYDRGDTWSEVTPTTDPPNAVGDDPAPEVGDLEWRALAFAGDYLVALATWQNASGEWRSWLASTADLETWTWKELAG